MYFILSLILLPLALSVLVLLIRKQKSLALLVRCGSALIIVLSVVVTALNFDGIVTADISSLVWLRYLITAIELLITAYIIYTAYKHRSWLAAVFSLSQIIILLWFEFSYGHSVEVTKSIYIDKLSLLMILIVGVIGSLICIYTVEYLKDFHRHHPEVKDRHWIFFSVMFAFLSAMLGLVMCNDMTLLLFCWEITTLCSFLLIGYTKKPEAVKNSLLALTVNTGGGLAFAVGIVILGVMYGVLDLESMLNLKSEPMLEAAVFLLAFAGLTKSAQYPFSRWLLGAMVAPSPSSALLHSSTMVKAGVYLILRLSPMLGDNLSGMAVVLVGGLTFLAAAIMAIAQSDAKKILAYSTISNLGLIVTCAGIGTSESIWAAILLIIFHAVAKALLFCAVGSTEHLLGSRDVEDMDGMFRISTSMTMLLIIGIAGMFVAPFGMLISKWAAMKAFLDAGNIPIVLCVAFGSTITLLFWTKWMGKLIANAHRRNPTGYIMRMDEKVSMYSMAALVIIVCLMHPLVSAGFISPYIKSNLHIDFVPPIGGTSTTVIILMMCLLFILPLVLIPFFRTAHIKHASVYLSGENTGDDESFRGGMGKTVNLEMRNWYMEDFFHIKLVDKSSLIISSGILLAVLLAVIERMV